MVEDEALERAVRPARGVADAALGCVSGPLGAQAEPLVVEPAVARTEVVADTRGRRDRVGVLVASEPAAAVGGEAPDGAGRRERVKMPAAPGGAFEIVILAVLQRPQKAKQAGKPATG